MATPDPRWHDTTVLPGWQDTAVLQPQAPAVAPGWYADPYDPSGIRYWDGAGWTNHCSGAPYAAAPRPPRRRSVVLGFVLAFFFGGLAFAYLLPLPWWARLLIAVAAVLAVGWWTLLLVPLSWPFAVVLVPLLAAVGNRGSS
jgi:hypothetical protein